VADSGHVKLHFVFVCAVWCLSHVQIGKHTAGGEPKHRIAVCDV
jgi:hypothetical protein